MKQYITGILIALFIVVGSSIPAPAAALSCMDPAGMLDMYTDEPEYLIFTATAGEAMEHVRRAAVEGDPNRQFSDGYTGQAVTASKAHKGGVSENFYVYHSKNATWGYMCSSGPVTKGEEALFITRQQEGPFGLMTVVNTYPADSDLARDIIRAVSEEGSNANIGVEMKDLRDEIMEMIFLVRIKLAEWRS